MWIIFFNFLKKNILFQKMSDINLQEPENLIRLPDQKIIRATSPIENSDIIHYQQNQQPQKISDQTLIKNSLTYLNNTINVLNLGQLCELEHVLHDRIRSLSKHASSASSDISIDSTLSVESIIEK
jgi:hypothetical protein